MAAVVVGGAGALGSAIVRALRRQAPGKQNSSNGSLPIVSVDYRACPCPEATHSVVLSDKEAWGDAVGERVLEEVRAVVGGNGQAASVFHAAGGWAGGAPGAPGFLGSVDRMWRMNGQSAALAAHLAGALLLPPSPTPTTTPPPLAVLTGASAALDPKACTGMLGYGMSKAATHFLVRSLAAHLEAQKNQSKGKGATVLAVLPTTLDTPANRAAMPGADFGGWTKPDDVGARLAEWAFHPETRPASGSLLKVVTAKGKTSWESAAP